MKIGFVGLGIMGKPMSKNLMKAGYELVISSSNPDTNKELGALGAEVVDSYTELAAAADVIITMLPNSPEVKQVVLERGGLIDGAKSGSVVIDMSSIAPTVSQEIGKALQEKDIGFLDAPVSGGEPKAIDGTIAVMAGGAEETFQNCLPIMEAMAGSVVRTGEVGSGNATKLANQIIVALNIAAVSEAMMLTRKMGVDSELVYNAIRGGLAGSNVLDAKAPMMMEGNFDPGFTIDLHLKDLNNVLETSSDIGVPLPLAASVKETLQALQAGGHGDNDHAAIVKFYEKLANMTED
ncbi:2-hydroxy-3-oxopropionate reductase [Lentibacillus cibarius]|uniref:2-hydroxy-3-oxopropionate reductase n=1 Tax=Lentibacillus cibarius TaxID=2583219 RepID=A0A549YJP5_9BACI|nr:2-hydroxy-3-oxopropionate reductase [Lentibacillus cibarius]TMN23916.1 2-hydroxy-3-oxopropionate reductase [Lentibacillus cibarius]TRM12098.1 2-hydroxy-3-oxopropionate reductase [Lentibacillus cibarius]